MAIYKHPPTPLSKKPKTKDDSYEISDFETLRDLYRFVFSLEGLSRHEQEQLYASLRQEWHKNLLKDIQVVCTDLIGPYIHQFNSYYNRRKILDDIVSYLKTVRLEVPELKYTREDDRIIIRIGDLQATIRID